MSVNMRALYYVQLATPTINDNGNISEDDIKANENCLNQNFTILAQAIEDLYTKLQEQENN